VLQFVLTAAMMLATVPADGVAIPLDATLLAIADAEKLSPEHAFQRRYVWCRNEEEVTAVQMMVNLAVSRAAYDVQPEVIAGGRLVAIDLRVCSFDDKHFAELLSLWASMSDREPYFHDLTGARRISVKPYRATDGKTYDFKFIPVSIAAHHLGEAGMALESLLGNLLPLEQSVCPIVRADWFVKESSSTIDGGRYYDFRGLKLGMKLDDYLASRGADQKLIEKLGANERAAMISGVTGKARAITMFQGQGVRVSTGAGVIAITDDPFDANLDPSADPFRQLLDSKSNGHEVFVTLPSGWLEYTLFDGEQKLIAEAPGNLVTDSTVPAPFTARLQSAISCIRCHAPQDGWKPFVNEVQVMLGDRVRPLGDTRNLFDPHSVLSQLAAKYSGDLSEAIKVSQDAMDRRVFKVTRKTAADSCLAVANVFNRYEYEHLTARTAAMEIGWEVPAEDKLGVDTFRQLVPPLHADGLFPDDPILSRFHVKHFDIESGQQKGLRNTRRQWELIYPSTMNRNMPLLLKAREDKAKIQPQNEKE
jgi:hypothetical protein